MKEGTTRRVCRGIAVAVLATGLGLCQPAWADTFVDTSATAAVPTSAPDSGSTSLAGAAAGVQNAAAQVASAQRQVEAATATAQQLAYAVVALHDQLAAAQTAVDTARSDARESIRVALDQADTDPTTALFAALDGGDPGLASHVRVRQLGDVASRTHALTTAVSRLNALNREESKRLEAALGAAARAVSAADKARIALAAAQQVDQELRDKIALAAQQSELNRLNAELAASLAAVSASSNASYAPINATNLPASLRALYKRGAATCPGLPWSVLAGIGQVETDHGQNKNISSAGAMGPMQFMPATWAEYGIDGDGDGVANILDQADAIFSAAHYLCANGGGDSATLYSAIFNYNHSDYYVNTVLAVAAQYH